MKTATVIRSFLRNEVEMMPGQTFECSEQEYIKWQRLGFVAGYETKVVNEPVKKKETATEPSGSSQADPAPQKRTRKSSKRSVKKSS